MTKGKPRKPAAGKKESPWTTGEGTPEKVPQRSNKKSTGNPMQGTDPMQRCGAKCRDGSQCTNPPRRGAKRCRMHGSSNKVSIEAARRRLQAAADPAAARLEEALEAVDEEGQPSTVAVRAAKEILDRAGLPAVTRAEITGMGGEPVQFVVDPGVAAKKKPKGGKKE